MLSDDPVSDECLDDWSKSSYGLVFGSLGFSPHWTESNGCKNWIGDNTTDFVSQAHSYGLEAESRLVYFLPVTLYSSL